MLSKIAGTPLGDVEDLELVEFVRTIAVATDFNACPLCVCRQVGKMNEQLQALCFAAGAN